MINTQLLKPLTCECRIMQKTDTDFPNQVWYITKEEYLSIIQSKQGQVGIITMQDAEVIGNRIRVCDRHQALGHTKEMMEKVFEESSKLNKATLEMMKVPSMVNSDGELKKKFSFSFDDKGEINIYPIDFTEEEKNIIKSKDIKLNG